MGECKGKEYGRRQPGRLDAIVGLSFQSSRFSFELQLAAGSSPSRTFVFAVSPRWTWTFYIPNFGASPLKLMVFLPIDYVRWCFELVSSSL